MKIKKIFRISSAIIIAVIAMLSMTSCGMIKNSAVNSLQRFYEKEEEDINRFKNACISMETLSIDIVKDSFDATLSGVGYKYKIAGYLVLVRSSSDLMEGNTKKIFESMLKACRKYGIDRIGFQRDGMNGWNICMRKTMGPMQLAELQYYASSERIDNMNYVIKTDSVQLDDHWIIVY